ncbi:hypothetical protein L202_03373 [Cryptococcus amylolentus CBS 6039]|uniref:Diphthine--ammonia ligase n=1 Tax=Cryptococcus amylolentus CBS 6039 TaxID=1295533 RepID=A0A1E3HSN3_9TREE|nr:hypothetical protein L202_03373 [Cryptococcus amylolentus CBS 6039]ODN79369.1 hypothetical protein L202_03373 [Cryptococcus amylolentus CBS 6039]
MSSSIPGVKQKVIGLVSGGKDSCFNLMHCIANGHEIVALATLTPEEGIDELDSHLYQSVGTHLLPLLAKSMDIPLFTGIIRGHAVEKGPEYGSRLRGGEGSGEQGDETEDLTSLLRTVLAKHPDATALASGAILSTYQRIRIEHVCGRLGLTSLSYLWQSEQGPLLNRMLASGVEAVIMKVAGVGLGPRIVGKQLGAIMPLLSKLEAQYGSHPAGEGGEYETLTLSTPLFSHRLNLVETKVIITDPEPYPVAYLKVIKAELEEKPGWKKPTVNELRELLGLDEDEPGLAGLDEEGQERLEELGSRSIETFQDELDLTPLQVEDKEDDFEVQFAQKGRWFTVGVQGRTVPDEDVGAELKSCFDAISTKLQSQNLSLPLHAAHITLLLSDMSLFLPVNAIYKTYFGTSPPSRATVAVPLSSGRVRVEVVGFDDTPSQSGGAKVGGRSALHVQGLSYWAPANIGPYSQAVLVSHRLHLAGQIPLIPASLTLPPPTQAPLSAYPHQATLALQHVGRILGVMRSKNSTGGGWEGWVESVVGWWARTGGGGDGEGVGVARDAWRIWAARNGATQAPALFVQAKELPKGALVEYQVNLHTGRRDQTLLTQGNDDDDDDDDELKVVYEQCSGEDMWWESSRTVGRDLGCRGIVFAKDVNALVRSSGPEDAKLALLLAKAVSIRVYHTLSIGFAEIHSLLPSLSPAAFTLVPVFSIHDRQGRSVPLALEVFGI